MSTTMLLDTPTSEPSEEEVPPVAEKLYRMTDCDCEGCTDSSLCQCCEERSLLASRRASRVETTTENAGASAAGASPETTADADEVAESIAALTNAAYAAASHREPTEEAAWKILDWRDGWEDVVSSLRSEADTLDKIPAATNAGDVRAAADFIEALAQLREPKANAPQSVDAAASHREPSESSKGKLVWPTDPSYPCPTCGHVPAREPSEPVTDDMLWDSTAAIMDHEVTLLRLHGVEPCEGSSDELGESRRKLRDFFWAKRSGREDNHLNSEDRK